MWQYRKYEHLVYEIELKNIYLIPGLLVFQLIEKG